MAVSFCNHSLLTPPRPSSSFSVKPSKILQPKPLLPLRSLHHRPRLSNPIIGFPLSNSSPLSNYYSQSRSFKAYLAAEDSALTEDHRNDVKASEEKADGEQSSSLKNLIRIYKAAILHGDERIVLDIESRIKDIENEHTQLMQKVSALSAEITSGKEKTIRLQADFDNFRKRSEKEKLNIRSDAQGEVIESLLPLVDSFERAKQQLKPETEKEKKIDTSYQGIYKQFVEIMRSLQVVAVATVGKPFDPAMGLCSKDL
ncbi:protein GrpE isoform X2 [Manihot esculenta]|uniref:Uncharacterized protein n=1 Tax=Manihot esculenta TaxID=3983 RepID=A0ACB7FZW8_MANES|nr:protein GrpE isoform X2 [Manihot esculenta]KAG8633023.1 hypothetical protein MANES_18G072300v8 [Manihot esculenta]